jgi:hypothetical protein
MWAVAATRYSGTEQDADAHVGYTSAGRGGAQQLGQFAGGPHRDLGEQATTDIAVDEVAKFVA